MPKVTQGSSGLPPSAQGAGLVPSWFPGHLLVLASQSLWDKASPKAMRMTLLSQQPWKEGHGVKEEVILELSDLVELALVGFGLARDLPFLSSV